MAINAGLNLQQVAAISFPLSFGIGYSRVSHDLGNFISSDELGQISNYFTSGDHSTNFTFSAGLDYIIKIGLGYTTKSVESDLAPFDVQGQGKEGVAHFSTYDVGLITQIPLIEIYKRAGGTMPGIFSDVEPLFDLTLGYSRNNLGDNKVMYIDPAQGDPLPRTASAGLNVKLGLASHTSRDNWRWYHS
jgi:hypothetical protein